MQKYINAYYYNTIMTKNNSNERRTTSIKANPQLWKEVKKFCIDENVDISDWLEDIIRKELAKKR